MFKTNYQEIKKQLRARRREFSLKNDQSLIEKSLSTLSSNLDYTVYSNLQALADQVNQSIDLRRKFLRDNSEENFRNAFQASESSIISYGNLREVFSRSASFLNNYGCSSTTHQFFNPGIKKYSKSISLFQNAIAIKPLYHFAWFNLGVVYQLKGNYKFGYLLKFISYIVEAINLLLPHIFKVFPARETNRKFNGNYINQKLHLLKTAIELRASNYTKKSIQTIQSAINNLWSNRDENSEEGRDSEITNTSEIIKQLQQINQLLILRNPNSVHVSLENLIMAYQDDWYIFSHQYSAPNDLGVNLEILDKAFHYQTTEIIEQHNQLMAIRSILNWLFHHAILDFSLPNFNPEYSIDWENLGQAAIKKNHFLEGIISIAQAIKLSANNISSQSYYHLGIAHFYRGYYEDAIICFDRATTLNPKWTDPLKYKGHAHNEIADYSTAILVFKQYLQSNQNHLWSHLGIATAQYHLHNYHSAIITFQELIAINHTEPKFYLGVIQSLYGDDDSIEALLWLKELVELQNTYWQFYLSCITLRWYPTPINTLRNSGGVHCTDFYYLVGQISWNEGCSVKKINEQEKWFRLAKENLLNGFESLDRQLLEKDILNEKKIEFIELLIPLYKALAEVSLSSSDTIILAQESVALQREGENILARLLENLPSKGKQLRLFMKFSSFSALRIDQLAQSKDLDQQKQALVFAEIHKNLCLEHMKNGYCSQQAVSHSISYQRIESILQNNNDTAIIYWHISPASVTTFIIRQDQLVVYRHSRWSSQGFKYWLNLINKIFFLPESKRLRTFYFPKNIQQLSELEIWLRNWKQDYMSYQGSLLQGKERHPWRLRMRSNLQDLSSILGIKKIQNYIKGANNLILIPHRELHLIPMHLLFGDNLTIRYLPSLFFGEHNDRNTQFSQDGIVFIGEYTHNLKYSFLEKETIEQIFSSRVVTFGQGEVNFRLFCSLSTHIRQQNLARPIRILHFSGHAKHNHCDPWQSGLELEERVMFTVGDILKNASEFQNLDLICLSACETGITSSKKIVKEYIGLSSAFLSSGCNTIVSSLWSVPDHVTALLFMKFYQLLADNQNPSNRASVALKQAQKWIRELNHDELTSFIDSNQSIFNQSSSLQRTLNREFSKSRNSSESFSAQVKFNTFAGLTGLSLFPEALDCPYEHPYYWAGFTVSSIDA
jgi:CHAT domain-containing protein/tetratricopeptide (TPR) repeat protein